MRATIKLKLAAVFAVVILLSAATAWFGISNMASLDATLKNVVEGSVKRLALSQELGLEAMKIVRNEKDLTLRADKSEIGRFDAEVIKRQQALMTRLDQAEATASAEGKPLWAAAQDALRNMGVAYGKIRTAIEQENKDLAHQISSTELASLTKKAETKLDAIVAFNRKQLEADRAEADARYDSARLLMISLVIGSLLIAAAAATWIALSISKGLSRAVALADAVAIGDLEMQIEVRSNDEIKNLVTALNRMTANLRATAQVADTVAGGDLRVDVKPLSDKDVLGLSLKSMVEKLRVVVADALSAADNVSAGSQELSSSSEELSQGATEQASSAEEASSSMEEMAANIKQNADNAAQTEKIARQSASDAQASGNAVTRAVEAMQTIAQKISVVQEIARQTDLLALNAAVEAARAGEHGKGFAVVASEVRKLAERSQTAAAEINTVSAQTVKAAEEAGEMLTRLVPDIQKTAELVAEISAASREQDIGADQINQAIQQLDKVTQQNASASEEMSATSEELAAQAEQLQTSIAYFRVEDRTMAKREAAPVRAAAAKSAKPAAEQSAAAKPAPQGAKKLLAQVESAYGNISGEAKPNGKSGVTLDLTAGGHDHNDAQFERAV